MPKLHPGQREILESDARFKMLACGRRWGKTRLGAAMCIGAAITGQRAWWVAPSYKVARVGWRLIYRLAAQMPGAIIRRGDLTVRFGTGEVAVRSADNPDSLRGEGLDFVVIDECAFIGESAWSEALRPALSDRQGAAMFISTPSGRNWFWRLWQRGTHGHNDYKSWRFPTAANPYIVASEIEAARLSLPDSVFRQEYLAEFLENEGAVFRNIGNCINAPMPPKSHAGHRLVAGIDWAKHKDFTAISIGCSQCREEVALDRFNQIDYVIQRERLGQQVKRWQAVYGLAELNSIGEPNLEMLQRDGLPIWGFQTTATSKPPLIQNLALALEREEWQFLSIPVATSELEAYTQKVNTTTGRSTYSAPSGMHDDTVIARALMLRAAGDGGSRITG